MSKNDNYCVGCTTCCQWAGELEVQVEITPHDKEKYELNPKDPTRLATKPNGDCIYLNRETGCTIHDKRPLNCRSFDCRELLVEVMKNPRNIFMRTLMEAVRIKTVNIIRKASQAKKKKKKGKIVTLRP